MVKGGVMKKNIIWTEIIKPEKERLKGTIKANLNMVKMLEKNAGTERTRRIAREARPKLETMLRKMRYV